MTGQNQTVYFCVLLSLISLLQLVSGESSPNHYNLPSNSTVVNGGPIITGFSCDGLQYGYYADVANQCRVFHVCYPYLTADNFIFTRMFSFICGFGTVFNQEALVCDYPSNSIPCQESPSFYRVNDHFGREDAHFRQ